ncbi:Protein of unknown function [Asanoa ishikariensis]|uniref:DUF4245 domain-containing protein n=1 Tax=Asanoa ishikariensis TaxID=137265 RepID=A0A1H3QWB8_9ACTN|nr:DUF4245 domain-containing protein [Asanoa ishikariensis]SDZ17268.1 Protein of unknown function [Asanoa ishikariensis]
MEQEASTKEIVASAQRSERRPRDMVISMLVLLVPILLAFGVYRVFFDGNDPIAVDPAMALDDARHANAFPVLVPTGLSGEWTTVTARWQQIDGGKALRLGLVSPDGKGVQVVQTDAEPTKVIPAELTAKARPEGTVEIAGASWQTYSTRPGERALVKLDPDSTVILMGEAGDADLRTLAGSLK